MTIERLDNYRTIKRQIKLYQEQDISYINGVNLDTPSVQSSTKSDRTASLALKKIEQITQKEYESLCDELVVLNEYIMNISDFTIKEIAKKKFIYGMTYEDIAEQMNYSRVGVYKKLKKYIKSH